VRIYTPNLNLPRRSAKRLLQIQMEAAHKSLKTITGKIGQLDQSRAENFTAEVLGYLHRADLAACHREQPPSLLDEELDSPAELEARHDAQARQVHKIYPAIKPDEARALINAWRPSASRAVFDPKNRHPERYVYRENVKHFVFMAPLGRWYINNHGALMISPKRRQLERVGVWGYDSGEFRLAMLFDPYDGACHIEVYTVRQKRPHAYEPDMQGFLHRAWTRLGVPDTLEFKTPSNHLLRDDDDTLRRLPKRLGVQVEWGRWDIAHVDRDPQVTPALKAFDLALTAADDIYRYSVDRDEDEDVEWVWHEANLGLLGAAASEEFPRFWRQHGEAQIVADNAEGRQRMSARELESGWLDAALNGAPDWASDPEFCVYNWTNSPDWQPFGVGINTDPEDFFNGFRFRYPGASPKA
jgi:hypothetical protein